MLPFPREEIHDEDAALDWWEEKFAAGCEALNVQCNAASLVREFVSTLRGIRGAALDAPISLTEAAARTGYSADHIGRLVRDGKIPNVGRKNAPRLRPRDLTAQLKPKLALDGKRTYDPDSDARRLRVRR